jgi:hypothetical protein
MHGLPATDRIADPVEWPPLPLDGWRDTYATLHMWTQVVGKVCLALTPLTNHFWNIAFTVGSRGLATPSMTAGPLRVAMTFDFIDHQLVIRTSDGRAEHVALEPRTVADFYAAVMDALGRLGVRARIWTTPVEIPDPIPFERDTEHRSYDRRAVDAFWGVMVAITPVFEGFRSGFLGKCSPVHFFWGSFDLAVTRFSGERAPARAGADSITREAYSHCVISHGFWPGSGAVQEPAFYAYAAPEPEGLRQAVVAPAAARYETAMSEFVLPYEAVRTSRAPARNLQEFLETSYVAAADLAGWKRAELERA